MTDQDYIRAGVKLAGGWEYEGGEICGWIDYPDYTGTSFDCTDDMEEHWKDALAAQLVRQVDALDDHSIESGFEMTALIISCDLEFRGAGSVLNEVEGSDRAMNTIKVIVDSGVLK